MADRPILFSAPMVRALLSGTKTQTRRVVKGWPLEWLAPGMFTPGYVADPANKACPYGVPGDRLWVRESHWFFQDEHDPATGYTPPVMTTEDVEYRADGESTRHGWRPSIHMPRWASRITLNVTSVRVERLQSIGAADALAEGIPSIETPSAWTPPMPVSPNLPAIYCGAFCKLWSSINGAESWDANPWVWVVEFERAAAAMATKAEGQL